MKTSLLASSCLSKSVLLLALAAVCSAAPALAAAESPVTTAPKVAVVIVSSDETVKQQLLELDRRLDANPGFEEVLRKNIDQLTEESFLKKNPDVATLIKQQPGIVPALKADRHFLIHRYIALRARGPLLHRDVLALDKFLTAHPDIRKALDNDPAQIMESKFLTAHSSLAGFFDQHASLGTVLMENPAAPSEPKQK